MANLGKIIPPAPRLAQEVVVVLIGTIGAAWIISKFPALQRLVSGNSVPGPFNQTY